MGENFALRWNDFHSNLESLFKHLRSATEYQDVTLVCGREAAEVRAHKVRGVAKGVNENSRYYSHSFRKIRCNRIE